MDACIRPFCEFSHIITTCWFCSVPVMSVVFDLTNMALSAGSSTSLTINCGLNISSIPYLPTAYSHRAISELYEVPRSASINMFLNN